MILSLLLVRSSPPLSLSCRAPRPASLASGSVAGFIRALARDLGDARLAGVDGMLALDPAGRLVLTVTSALFFLVALYVVGYLAAR